MELVKYLPQRAMAVGGDSGGTLDLKLIPTMADGGTVYVRRIKFRITGSITKTTGGNANLTKLISRVNLNLPGFGDLVEMSGNQLVRIFRVEHRGGYPPFNAKLNGGAGTAAAVWDGVGALPNNGANNVDMTFVLEFHRPFARSPDDFSVPASLLRHATVQVYDLKALADIAVDVTAIDLSLSTAVEYVRKGTSQMPVLTTLDRAQLQGIQPVITPMTGRLATGTIVPQTDDVFPATTDYNKLGIRFGNDLVLSEPDADVRTYYSRFASGAVPGYEFPSCISSLLSRGSGPLGAPRTSRHTRRHAARRSFAVAALDVLPTSMRPPLCSSCATSPSSRPKARGRVTWRFFRTITVRFSGCTVRRRSWPEARLLLMVVRISDATAPRQGRAHRLNSRPTSTVAPLPPNATAAKSTRYLTSAPCPIRASSTMPAAVTRTTKTVSQISFGARSFASSSRSRASFRSSAAASASRRRASSCACARCWRSARKVSKSCVTMVSTGSGCGPFSSTSLAATTRAFALSSLIFRSSRPGRQVRAE